MEPLLTIAFPTYKRPHRIRASIAAALASKNPKIEVIVCDNNEDFATRDALADIADSRFSYHRNGKNLGFRGNFKACIFNARGIFTLIVSDEDKVNCAALEDILTVIENYAKGFGESGAECGNISGDIVGGGGQRTSTQPNLASQILATLQNSPAKPHITEIISGVAYENETDRYYVAPPKNKNAHLTGEETKRHPLYRLLRSYVSGFCFNTAIARHVYAHKIATFEDSETYFYYPFWVLGWLMLDFGGAYTYNSLPLILKTTSDASSYIEADKTPSTLRLFSFASELKCFCDKMRLSKNDPLNFQFGLDSHNIYYLKNCILKNDKTTTWSAAKCEVFKALQTHRKHPRLSIISFHIFSLWVALKRLIKRLINYQPRYKI